MIEIWKNEWKKYRLYYQTHAYLMFLLFLVVGIFTYRAMGTVMESNGEYEGIKTALREFFSHKGVASDITNFEIMLELIQNNVEACVIGIVLGFIPIIIFPYLSTAFNGMIIGVVLRLWVEGGNSLMSAIVLGLLPHGITELTAMFLSTGMGSFASISILRMIFRKRKEGSPTLKELCKMIGMSFATVVIPLLVISAVIEAYVTPLLLASTM